MMIPQSTKKSLQAIMEEHSVLGSTKTFARHSRNSQFSGTSIVNGSLTGGVEGPKSYRRARAFLSNAIRELD